MSSASADPDNREEISTQEEKPAEKTEEKPAWARSYSPEMWEALQRRIELAARGVK